jgi:hypothetical protein
MSIPQRTWHREGHADAVMQQQSCYPEGENKTVRLTVTKLTVYHCIAYRRQKKTVGFRISEPPRTAIRCQCCDFSVNLTEQTDKWGALVFRFHQLDVF